MRVQNHDGVLFIQVVKQGVQFGRAQILPLYVGRKLDAVGLERIEGVSRFGDGLFHVGQRECRAVHESTGVLLFQGCTDLVHLADDGGTFVRVAEIGLRGSERQNGRLHLGFVHPFQVGTYIPFGERETFVQQSVMLLQIGQIIRRNHVGMNVDGTAGKGGRGQGGCQNNACS